MNTPQERDIHRWPFRWLCRSITPKKSQNDPTSLHYKSMTFNNNCPPCRYSDQMGQRKSPVGFNIFQGVLVFPYTCATKEWKPIQDSLWWFDIAIFDLAIDSWFLLTYWFTYKTHGDFSRPCEFTRQKTPGDSNIRNAKPHCWPAAGSWKTPMSLLPVRKSSTKKHGYWVCPP